MICIDPLEFAFCSWQHRQNLSFNNISNALQVSTSKDAHRVQNLTNNNVIFLYIRSYIIIIVALIFKSKRFVHHISCVMKDTQEIWRRIH